MKISGFTFVRNGMKYDYPFLESINSLLALCDEVIVAERPQGTFTRRLFLSEGWDADGIRAQYEHGVLKVTVPVAASAKSRKIDIALGSGR